MLFGLHIRVKKKHLLEMLAPRDPDDLTDMSEILPVKNRGSTFPLPDLVETVTKFFAELSLRSRAPKENKNFSTQT